MKSALKSIFAGSKIIGFFNKLNKILLIYFYDSKAHGLFLRINHFFNNIISKNITKSMIVGNAQKAMKQICLRDIGLFFVLSVIFNTLITIAINKEIDIFSMFARIFFFALGIFLMVKKNGTDKNT